MCLIETGLLNRSRQMEDVQQNWAGQSRSHHPHTFVSFRAEFRNEESNDLWWSCLSNYERDLF